jgi:hypothetical protein
VSKITKLLRRPGPFLRDFLLKRYPEVSAQNREPPHVGSLVGKPIAPTLRHEEHDPFQLSFPIDVVYTWVDGSDEGWRRKKRKAQAMLGMLDELVTTEARFACRGELKYSLRSLECFAPWVNRIFIVTDQQVPRWLDTKNPRIRVVDHREIIPEQYLPTFNSHVIEAHLHRIPELSEHYLYFNDDVMLARPLSAEHMFGSNGNAHLFITRSETAPGLPNRYDTPTARAAKNVRRFIEGEFGQYMRFNFAHTYHPQLKSVHEQMHERWAPAFEAFLGNRFRSPSDLAVATYLFPNVAYLWQRADIRQTSCMYFNIRSSLSTRNYRMLLARRGTEAAPHSLCLNDVSDRLGADFDFGAAEREFLETYFPNPSAFERREEVTPLRSRGNEMRALLDERMRSNGAGHAE